MGNLLKVIAVLVIAGLTFALTADVSGSKQVRNVNNTVVASEGGRFMLPSGGSLVVFRVATQAAYDVMTPTEREQIQSMLAAIRNSESSEFLEALRLAHPTKSEEEIFAEMDRLNNQIKLIPEVQDVINSALSATLYLHADVGTESVLYNSSQLINHSGLTVYTLT